MSWLLSIISLPKLIAGIGTLLAVVLGFIGIRKSGKDALRAKQAKDALKRAEAGRKAVAKAKASDAEADDIARSHDGDWR